MVVLCCFLDQSIVSQKLHWWKLWTSPDLWEVGGACCKLQVRSHSSICIFWWRRMLWQARRKLRVLRDEKSRKQLASNDLQRELSSSSHLNSQIASRTLLAVHFEAKHPVTFTVLENTLRVKKIFFRTKQLGLSKTLTTNTSHIQKFRECFRVRVKRISYWSTHQHDSRYATGNLCVYRFNRQAAVGLLWVHKRRRW